MKKYLQDKKNLVLQNDINQSIQYLNSVEATKTLLEDPYWPKWNSSWWHILCFIEIDKINCIPKTSLINLKKSIEKNILTYFPLLKSEIPPQVDPYRNIICHCALGTLIQIDIKTENDYQIPPWIENWFSKYQLNDGGYNCDEESYTKDISKSSLVSTLPMLEALLLLLSKNIYLKDKQKLQKSLDFGVEYFLNRNLLCSSNDKLTPIKSDWLELTFPRFYEFDALRALTFINQYSIFNHSKLPLKPCSIALDHLLQKVEQNGHLQAGFHTSILDNQSLIKQSNLLWKFEKATRFPLLDSLEASNISSYYLSLEFFKLLSQLQV